MNRFRMTRQFLIALFSACFLFLNTTHLVALEFPTLSEEEYKSLSAAERQDYEKKLKEHIEQMSPAEQEAFMQQEVEKLYNSLPPEQQKEVLEEAARIEKMSEEEQRAYFKQVERELEEMFGQQEKAAPAAEPAPAEKATPAAEITPEEPVKKTIAAPQISDEEKALKEAISLLNEINQALDDLSAKLESMVNLQAKITSWGKKKKISAWDGGFEWKTLKNKISTFRAQLEKLKDRDTTTKKHKYLPHLLENKGLYTQLYNLSVDLAENEPTVRGGTNESVTPQIRARSNKAIRSLITTFTELFWSSKKDGNIIASLDTLFAKFDPEAKKIAGKETKAQQKAFSQSKQPTPSSSVKVAGASRESSSRYGGYGDDYSSYGSGRGYNAGSSNAYPSSSSSPYGDDRYKPSTSSDKPSSPSTPSSTTAPTSAPVDLKKDDRLNKLIKRFDPKIEAISDTLTEVPTFKKLPTYLKEEKVDLNFATKQVPELNNQLNKATIAIDGLIAQMKTLSEPAKAAYKKDISIQIDYVKKDLEKLLSDLSGINESTATTPEMKYAHFGKQPEATKAPITPPTTEAEKTKAKISEKIFALENPLPLPELKKSVDEFLKKVRELNNFSK